MLLIVFFGGEGDSCWSCFFVLGVGSVLLIVFFYFGRGIRVAHRFCFEIGSVFFFWGGGSVLLIVFGFGRGIRVAHRFLLWEGDPCWSSFFVLGG